VSVAVDNRHRPLLPQLAMLDRIDHGSGELNPFTGIHRTTHRHDHDGEGSLPQRGSAVKGATLWDLACSWRSASRNVNTCLQYAWDLVKTNDQTAS
jgi:hypothetical protein